MGKSIQQKWMGEATVAGKQIVVDGVKFADGSSASGAYIIKQTGSTAYVVQDAGKTHEPEIVFMVNASSIGRLAAGECFITATPFGGSALPCKKIAQYRVDLYEVDGSINSYSWGSDAATSVGQADLNLA